MASQTSECNTVIYYNDFIDSDNMTAALALRLHTMNDPSTRVLWIVEPRQVLLGPGMSGSQIAACKELIQKYFHDRGNPFKVLLGGLLKEEDINSIDNLPSEERDLLRMAIAPAYGDKEDAELHAQLMAWELANCLTQWSESPVEVFIDRESLGEIENPVNLNLHHHEELMNRSREELTQHEEIMRRGGEERTNGMRKWYADCIDHAQKQGNKFNTVKDLDLDALCETIKTSNGVRFLGGSSLRILKKFHEKGVANKLRCHLQVGSCDLSANLFPNQFNIALNRDAAKFVFDNFNAFADFTVVPSHSAQSIKYSSTGLKEKGGKSLEKRILGFNCREDPLKIANGDVTLGGEYPEPKFAMPDLTSFLCALHPEHLDLKKGYVRVEDNDGVLLFREDTTGIPMCDLKTSRTLEYQEVKDILTSG